VSPGLIAGRLTMLARSTVSTALISLSPCSDAVPLTTPDRLRPALPSPASLDAPRACGPAPHDDATARWPHGGRITAPAAPTFHEPPQDVCTADNRASRARTYRAQPNPRRRPHQARV